MINKKKYYTEVIKVFSFQGTTTLSHIHTRTHTYIRARVRAKIKYT